LLPVVGYNCRHGAKSRPKLALAKGDQLRTAVDSDYLLEHKLKEKVAGARPTSLSPTSWLITQYPML
jgi:hypothetical protein